ncbi:hypothetical protein J7547_07255 [Wohlfahrtiimonas chitiniclastica]|uniref:Uncharacterized protein n=1 Tax=Wohlfahrtiimonas chitiniclastica TaxID=400946 RepID=A0AB35BYG9_9GAMM|nr:hypothetical protein [Wohlfahrtiimonas chitiniclastica]MBS7825013.1 hypothetical protein [Wohlfahrtiimonas chitiniclastica]MBS7840618.1 hypothetical protein [Wohlfahrtiimonas chitiniclastica]
MFEVIYTGTDKSQLLQNYWAMSAQAKFMHSKADLSVRFNVPVHMLDQSVKNLGYAVITDADILCPQCNQPHQYFNRSDLDNLVTDNTVCSNCLSSNIDQIIYDEYLFLAPYIETYYKISGNNQRKFRYPNTAKLINSLSLLEMIFLYNIINEVHPKNSGELGLKAFSKFLYSEPHSNIVIQSLIQKEVLSHTTDETINQRLLDFYFLCDRYKNHASSSDTARICQKLIDPIVSTPNYALWKYDLIWKPSDYTFEEFADLLLIKIENYQVQFTDLEQIMLYLKQKRHSEVLFLAQTVEYNHKVKIKKSNAFESKSKELCEHHNIQMIYGYFMAAINLSLIALDHYPDIKRKKIKNSLYSNCLIGNKVTNFYEKNMPSNYNYSKNIAFIEERYNLGNIWLETSVNYFIDLLINKINI